MPYQADPQRYAGDNRFCRCGASGLYVPRLSLGLWHNFGEVDRLDTARAMLRTAFDQGITHFDLGNNYGPPPGSAETTLGTILREDLAPYRDELIISTKAGYRMWPGPYGDGGSRKYLISSLEQSLCRLGLDYVDIFYHHRPDPETPLAETMGALDAIVRSGRALYVGLSNYSPEQTREAAAILRQLGTPCVIHQPSYHMFRRQPEEGLFATLQEEGIGGIVFSPLAGGQLSDKYLKGIPADSRAGRPSGALRPEHLTAERLAQIGKLNTLAQQRGQSLVQMSLTWVLRQPAVTSALIGASRPEQITQALGCLDGPPLSAEELASIEHILANDG